MRAAYLLVTLPSLGAIWLLLGCSDGPVNDQPGPGVVTSHANSTKEQANLGEASVQSAPISKAAEASSALTPELAPAVTESVKPPVVTLTPKAAATVRRLIADQKGDLGGKVFLRLQVLPVGCQGFSHKLELVTAVAADELVSDAGGISVVTLKRQADLVSGAKVDYFDDKGVQGFKIETPNLKGEVGKKWLEEQAKEKDIK